MSRLTLALSLTLLLSACGGGPAVRDYAPRNPPDVSDVPDAQPRWEPRSRYGNPSSYVVHGRRYYVMKTATGFSERGIASWYGKKFHGRRTSSGEPYDMYAMTAAHKELPLPSYVEVRNLRNGRTVVVKVNDRGPFVDNRIIDLSYTAAAKLDMLRHGTAPVEIRVVAPGEPTVVRTAARSATPPPVPSAKAERNVRYYVQVGAFTEHTNASRLRARLSAGLDAAPVEIQSAAVNGRTVYRVRLGPLADVAEVDRLTAALLDYGITDTHVAIVD